MNSFTQLKFPLFIALLIPLLLAVLLAIFKSESPNKSQLITLKTGEITEALTYNHHKVSNNESKYVHRFDYIYFVDNQVFTGTCKLGAMEGNYAIFKTPALCKLTYRKDQPQIHDINLEWLCDTISNKALKDYASQKFELTREGGKDIIRQKIFSY
jgi:hypothetical protein